MLYHIINDDEVEHYKSIFLNIVSYSQAQHFFIVVANLDKTDSVRQFFQRNSIENYYIIDGRKNKKVPFLMKFLFRCRRNNLQKKEWELLGLICEIRKEPIILHGIYYSALAPFVFLGYIKNISWVCWNWRTMLCGRWGSIKWLHYMQKKLSLKQFRKIICLMKPDADDIAAYINAPERVLQISYSSNNLRNLPTVSTLPVSYPIRILLGNNGYCMRHYLPVLRILDPIADKVEICFIISYGCSSDEVTVFKRECRQMLRLNISFWEDMVSVEEYCKRSSRYDIYVCPSDIQSGLGSIYRALMMGQRIFLRDFNYHWIKESGGEVQHINELIACVENFRRLDGESMRKNREVVMRIVDTSEKWEAFYQLIDHKSIV